MKNKQRPPVSTTLLPHHISLVPEWVLPLSSLVLVSGPHRLRAQRSSGSQFSEFYFFLPLKRLSGLNMGRGIGFFALHIKMKSP